MSRIYVHLGVEKTGSTLIQQTLYLMPELHERHGLEVISREAFKVTPLYKYATRFHDLGAEPDEARFRKGVHRFAEAFPASGNQLITHEFLLGSALRGFYRDAEKVIEVLHRAFRRQKPHYILYVKRQDRHIESLYKHKIQTGGSLTWEAFRKRYDWRRHDWNDLLDRLAAVVGRERLIVRPAELISRGSEVLVRDFLEACGIRWKGAIPDPGFSNRSYSEKGLEIARQCHPVVNDDERRLLRKFLLAYFTDDKQPKPVLLTDAERAGILDHFREANDRLFREYLPAYPAFNYAEVKP